METIATDCQGPFNSRTPSQLRQLWTDAHIFKGAGHQGQKIVLNQSSIPPAGVQANEFIRSSQALAVCQSFSTLLEVTPTLSSRAQRCKQQLSAKQNRPCGLHCREVGLCCHWGCTCEKARHSHILYSHLPCAHPSTPNSPFFY